MLLTDVDRQKLPSNHSCASNVTFLRVESVPDASRGKEDECNDANNLGSERSMVGMLVLAEGSEASEDDQEDDVCVPQGCWRNQHIISTWTEEMVRTVSVLTKWKVYEGGCKTSLRWVSNLEIPVHIADSGSENEDKNDWKARSQMITVMVLVWSVCDLHPTTSGQQGSGHSVNYKYLAGKLK